MASLRQAFAWNLFSSPFRIAAGLLQTAILARVLAATGSSTALGTYAVLSSAVITIVFITNFGMPQVYSRITADFIQRNDHSRARKFMLATLMVRGGAWTVLLLAGLPLVAAYDHFFRPGFIGLTGGWAAILAAAVWAVGLDVSGFAGRGLAASYEQKWQNAILLLSQVAAIPVIALGFIFPGQALILAIWGTALSMILRGLLFLVTFQKLTTEHDHSHVGIVSMLDLWRQELRQTMLLGADKVVNYFQTPSFVLLIIGALFGSEAAGKAFLILDLGAKIVAGISTPIAGLVLPAMSRAAADNRLTDAYSSAMAFQSAVGGILIASLGGFGAFVCTILYGNSVSMDAGLVGFVLGAIIFEYLMLDLTGYVLIVQRKIQRQIALKAACVVSVGIAVGITYFESKDMTVFFVVLFAVRVIFSSVAPMLCALSQDAKGRQMATLLGLLVLAPCIPQLVSKLTLPSIAQLGLVAIAVAVLLGITHGIVLSRETMLTIRTLAGRAGVGTS